MRRFAALVFVVILAMGCSNAAPEPVTTPAVLVTPTLPASTVDVSATVEAAVEATRTVDRSVQATSEARAEATRAVAPTATPVVMTIYAPTPEPYVAAPGTIEDGIAELYFCLQESEEFRSLYLTGIEQSGIIREAAGDVAGMLLEDQDLFVKAMLETAASYPEYALVLSLLGDMAGELCGPGIQAPASYELDMSDGDAEALLGEYFDCYHREPEVRALVESSLADDSETQIYGFLMSDRELFIAVSLAGMRQDPDSSESLAGLQLALEAMCH